MGNNELQFTIQELENGFLIKINGKNLVAKNIMEILNIIKKELSQKKLKEKTQPVEAH
jgi:hypothetical protein